MPAVKNLFLDFGGVILNIDFRKAADAFITLGVKNFENLYGQSHASPLFEMLETGKITEHEFYAQLRELAGIDLTDQDIQSAWNALLIEYSEESLDWIKQNAHKFNLYLFSNTNIIHLTAFEKMYEKLKGEKTFNQLFKKAYYSHELGYRKPDKIAFDAIIEKENLLPEETMLIDDTYKNIEGAAAAGWQTIHLKPPMKLGDLDPETLKFRVG